MYHLTAKSSNRKTGPIPVSTSTADTCPNACPLKRNGCYADGGPQGMHWRAVTEGRRGTDFETFTQKVKQLPDGQLWRHNVSGDLPGKDNRINAKQVTTLVRANKGKRGFTYTHKPMTEANRAVVKAANVSGFTINLSANNPAHADELAQIKVAPVVTVLPHDAPKVSHTPQGRKIVVCPAISNNKTSCADCALCQKADRNFIIGFPVHGHAHKKAANATNNIIAKG